MIKAQDLVQEREIVPEQKVVLGQKRLLKVRKPVCQACQFEKGTGAFHYNY